MFHSVKEKRKIERALLNRKYNYRNFRAYLTKGENCKYVIKYVSGKL